jgi:hypothetical protein
VNVLRHDLLVATGGAVPHGVVPGDEIFYGVPLGEGQHPRRPLAHVGGEALTNLGQARRTPQAFACRTKADEALALHERRPQRRHGRADGCRHPARLYQGTRPIWEASVLAREVSRSRRRSARL